MDRHDYRKEMLADVEEAFAERGIKTRLDEDGEKYQEVHDDLWTDDSVTGNGSGSYTFSTWVAEENLCHNLGLLKEAAEELVDTVDLDNPEGCDVMIRCYLLDEIMRQVNDNLPDDDGNSEEETDDEE